MGLCWLLNVGKNLQFLISGARQFSVFIVKEIETFVIHELFPIIKHIQSIMFYYLGLVALRNSAVEVRITIHILS
jgi:hypothetical protein